MIPLDLDALPPLSPLAMEMLALRVEDEDAERRLLRILSSEPQLAARVIGMANSVAYGLSRLRFSTLPLALRRIGLRRALQLCTAVLFGRPVSARLPATVRLQLWLHALANASACGELARLKHHPEAEEAYLAGLMHDLGYMVAELQSPGIIGQIATLAGAEELSLEEAERRLLGAEHGEITALLLAHWGVPAAFCDLYRDHHLAHCGPDSLQAILFGAEKLVRLDELADGLYGDRDHLFGQALLQAEGVGFQLQQQLRINQLEMCRIVDRILGQVSAISGLAMAMAEA